MAGAQRGLGRGLDALFKNTEAVEEQEHPNMLPLRVLQANPNQPRKQFDDAALEELAASIREKGVLQPLLVRPQVVGGENIYEIVAGERRFRASQLAGIREVPVVIRELDDMETLAIALIENLQREDLTPLEEANALQELKDQFNLSQEELAKQVGKSRSAVANTLRLLQLPDMAQDALSAGTITAGHARAILSVDDIARIEFLGIIVSQMLTVREAEAIAASWKQHKSFIAPDETKKESAKVVKTEALKEFQTRLNTLFVSKVTVSGTEQKGKVTLSYNTEEELYELLGKLGIEQAG
ncbi:ParB/RepB/Spo0J family partition protein [Halodesulfovibrio marinisediminis]|uniref:Chromosome segregation DNA-binding protein n=1 Tax=Halodesulfovibrio marinisediminis DSM 17456 TaxID=1121457 RepID=A0A1N6EUP7_9BACT|nr:ParB/RepB/Spo0J family partition protein [Halodesulfovibrio marinisediminis]SIN86710.1 chromosome segregation DNA-binding protein [Halodesulfovibrio marinisediminis DSM 17456]